MVKIVDYKAGNAPSVLHAVQRLGYRSALASRPEELSDATHIVLPGVGSAKATMQSLRDMGFISVLEEAVFGCKVMFLGICVGLQILFDYSEEGSTDCLGWLHGEVVRFDDSIVRVPQMGWNQVCFVQNIPTIETTDDYFYFVNSYYAKPDNGSDIWGEANYNGLFTAAVRKNNIYATQFHIEKSGEAGLTLLSGFLSSRNGG